MTVFSANLGFLFTEYDLPEAIRQAHLHGFAAVEFHWPYDVPSDEVKCALQQTGLPALSLNTIRGDSMGLCAQADKISEARASIEQAFAYGTQISANAVHLMAGFAHGDRAKECFLENLAFACDIAEQNHMTILIEALNSHDANGYFLRDTNHVAEIIKQLGNPHCKMMFDCYHVVKSGGDILHEFHKHLDMIGHIQFAGTPDMGAPDEARNNTAYAPIFAAMKQGGWHAPIGAEYRPDGPTDKSLNWLLSYSES